MKASLFFCYLLLLSPEILANDLKTKNDTMVMEKKADSISKLADLYFTLEQYERSLNEIFLVIEFLKKTNNINKQIYTYRQIINVFIKIRKFDLAVKYLKKISEISLKTKSPSHEHISAVAYGQYYIATQEYGLALRNLYPCLATLSKAPDLKYEGQVHKFIGDALTCKKEYGLAAYNYYKAIDAVLKIHDPIEIAVLYTRLAHVYYMMGNYQQNLIFNLKAMKIREGMGSQVLLYSAYRNVGDAHWLLGRNDSARYYFNKAHEMTITLQKAFYTEALYHSFSDFALSVGSYKEALEFNKKRTEYGMKLNLEKNRSEILILVANQSINENDALNEQLEQEIIIQKLLINNHKIQSLGYEAIFLSFLTIIFLIDFLIRNNKKKKLKLNSINNRLLVEIKDNKEAGQNLQQSEELHRFLAENTVGVISLLNADLTMEYISSSCLSLYGYPSEDITKMKNYFDLVDTEHQLDIREKTNEMIRTKNPARILYKAKRKNAPSFWVEAILNPIIGPDTNEVKEIIMVVRDYSENKKFEDEINENARQKEILLREIHNRVKNNFAILGSLIHLLPTIKIENNLSASLIDLQLRIRTMSLVHELLYKSQKNDTIPFDEYLKHLCWIIASAFKNDRIEIYAEACSCNLGIEITLPMGLIINELLTNAYKHAFPGNTKGKIKVKLEVVSQDLFRISVCDTGVGIPDNFNLENSTSMGTKIIGILVQQIEGNLSVSRNQGTCFHIEFSAIQEK